MKLKLPFNWIWIVVILGLWVMVRQVTSIIKLYRSGDKMKEAQAEVSQLDAQKAELEKKLASVDNPEYVERQLRDKLGYGKAGETVLILPHQEIAINQSPIVNKTTEPNWKQWWDLYIRL